MFDHHVIYINDSMPGKKFAVRAAFQDPSCEFVDLETGEVMANCGIYSPIFASYKPTEERINPNSQEYSDLLKASYAISQSRHTLLRVMEFHKAFNHTIRYSPTVPSFAERKLRVNLILEEVGEFISASGMMNTQVYRFFDAMQRYLMDNDEAAYTYSSPIDPIEAADALGDIDYVVAGANLVWGFPAEAIAREIHASNMSKLGADGKPVKREDGKILKGPNYFKPRIAAILYPEEEADAKKLEALFGTSADNPTGQPLGVPKQPWTKSPHSSQPPSE